MPPPVTAAVSAVKSLQDCANYDLTVKQHLPQLQNFVTKLLETVQNGGSLKDFYASTNPLVSAFAFSLFLGPIFLVVSEINKNYSQVDRCWSLLPTVYAVHYAAWTHASGMPTARNDLVALVSICWSVSRPLRGINFDVDTQAQIRLTFNYWRRGGYQIGAEDYRWNIIKDKIKPALFFLLNVSFISFGQSVRSPMSSIRLSF